MAQKIEWPGGWAELSDRLTHGRRMRVLEALPDGDATDWTAAQTVRFSGALVAAHVTAWSAGPVDAVYGPPAESIDALPGDAVDALTSAAMALWTGRADPNATTPSSDAGPSESASA